jgi:hypothetical protein
MYQDFYGNNEPTSTPSQILAMLARQKGVDSDLVSYSSWLTTLANGDLLADLMAHIIKQRHDPAIAPLFDLVCIEVSAVLDVEVKYDDLINLTKEIK